MSSYGQVNLTPASRACFSLLALAAAPCLLVTLLHAGEVLEVQAASNNTIKGGLTAPDEDTDRQNLVMACTGGLQASGQANSPALQAGVSISAADAAAHLTSTTPQDSSGGTNRIHEVPPRAVEPRGLATPSAGASSSGAQVLRLYQPEVDEFQVGA